MAKEVLLSWVQHESKVLLSLFLDLFRKQVSTLPLSFSKKGDRDRSRAYIMYNFIKQLAGNTKKILVTLMLGYTLWLSLIHI